MDIFNAYIMPVAMVICAVVCYILKNVIRSDDFDRFIPLISAVLGLLIVIWATWSITPEVVAQGLVSGLAATGMYELVKQFVRIQSDRTQNEEYYILDEELTDNDGEDQ